MWMDKVLVAVLLTVTVCHGYAIPLDSAVPTASAPKSAPAAAVSAPSTATKRLKREPEESFMELTPDFVDDEDEDEPEPEPERVERMRRMIEGQAGGPEGPAEQSQQVQPSTQTSAQAPPPPQAGATRPLVLYKMKHMMNPYMNPMLMNQLQGQQGGQPGMPGAGATGQPGQPRMLMMYKMKHMYPNPMMMG